MKLRSIGNIRAKKGTFELVLDKDYKDGLLELDQFSYIHVLWWADQEDSKEARATLVTDLPYSKGTKAGVFACRSPYRPNPVASSICPVLDVDMEKGVVTIAYIDAFDGTPLIDIKPYIPVSDRVKSVKTATWFDTWPMYYEDGAEFFSKKENQYE